MRREAPISACFITTIMSSPFSDFLFTNYAPTANESQKILEFCSQPAAELAQLNGKIMELQRALEVLICKRDEFEKILDTHLALLSPMRHIPTEILQKIFVHCLHTTRNSVMHASLRSTSTFRTCLQQMEASCDGHCRAMVVYPHRVTSTGISGRCTQVEC